TILTATLAAKDKLTFICKNLTTGEIDTDELVGSSIVTGAKLVFFDDVNVNFTIGATNSTFTEDGTYELAIVGFNVETQNAVDVDYDNTDSGLVGTNVKVAIDEVVVNTRLIGGETIAYRSDGKVSAVTSDTVETTPTYNSLGNLIKIIEVYALDNKTYETTFVRDALGRIINTNKQEVI
nr:hypothetical protein [Thiomicrorhabdus sp.]